MGDDENVFAIAKCRNVNERAIYGSESVPTQSACLSFFAYGNDNGFATERMFDDLMLSHEALRYRHSNEPSSPVSLRVVVMFGIVHATGTRRKLSFASCMWPSVQL